jgi:hypothetical protein
LKLLPPEMDSIPYFNFKIKPPHSYLGGAAWNSLFCF